MPRDRLPPPSRLRCEDGNRAPQISSPCRPFEKRQTLQGRSLQPWGSRYKRELADRFMQLEFRQTCHFWLGLQPKEQSRTRSRTTSWRPGLLEDPAAPIVVRSRPKCSLIDWRVRTKLAPAIRLYSCPVRGWAGRHVARNGAWLGDYRRPKSQYGHPSISPRQQISEAATVSGAQEAGTSRH
jgi:hypothetical protein